MEGVETTHNLVSRQNEPATQGDVWDYLRELPGNHLHSGFLLNVAFPTACGSYGVFSEQDSAGIVLVTIYRGWVQLKAHT